MSATFVVYAECKHGNTVGFCSSNVPDAAIGAMLQVPAVVALLKVPAKQARRRAGFCHACEADASAEAAAKRPIAQKLRDLDLMGAGKEQVA